MLEVIEVERGDFERAMRRFLADTGDRTSARATLPPQPKSPSPLHGWVYVVGFRRYIKIGWSSDVGKRLMRVQAGIPEKLKVLAIFPALPETEGNLHRRFAQLRLRGEWFRYEEPLDGWICLGCPL